MNTVTTKKLVRSLKALGYGLRYPGLLKAPLIDSIKSLYRQGTFASSCIEKKTIDQIFDVNKKIKLQNFGVREGNVSSFELMIIALIIANRDPKTLLEIGTFDGTTTLQMALNAHADATVHTIDLPEGECRTHLPIAKPDIKFIQDTLKLKRKYLDTAVASRVVQHLGDSTTYDFNQFIVNGPLDFCFVDGGHSYECVKSDTENTLKILASNGVILWHDFDPNWPGVYQYLSELSKRLPLIHIAGTQLVVFAR